MLYHYYYDCYGDLTALLDWFVDRSSFVIGWRVFAPGVSTSRQLVSLFAPTSSSYTHTLSITHSILYSLVCTALAKKAAPTVKYLPNTDARHFFPFYLFLPLTHSLARCGKSQLVLYTYSFFRSHYLATTSRDARAANLTTR